MWKKTFFLLFRTPFMFRGIQVGAGGLDAAVPTGTVIGLFDDGDGEGCLLDYSIDDAALQVWLSRCLPSIRSTILPDVLALCSTSTSRAPPHPVAWLFLSPRSLARHCGPVVNRQARREGDNTLTGGAITAWVMFLPPLYQPTMHAPHAAHPA